MKARKCIKTGLSVLLALAMLFTSVPGNLTMTVQASEIAGDEQQLTEAATADQDTLGGGTEGLAEEETKEDNKTQSEDVSSEDNSKNQDGDSRVQTAGVAGEKTGHAVDGKTVTFTYLEEDPKTFDSEISNIDSLKVEGQGPNVSWGNLVEAMTEDPDGTWVGTYDAPAAGVYAYKFVANGNNYQSGSNTELVVPGLGDTEINLKTNTTSELPASLDTYYSEGNNTPVTKEVVWELPAETSNQNVTLGGSDGKQTITIPETVTSGSTFKLTAKVKEEEDKTATVTVNVVDALPDTRTSPEINGNTVKFSYWAPTATSVAVRGELDEFCSWTEDKEEWKLSKNSESGYWELEKTLAPKNYEYKFVVNGTDWKQDPLNPYRAAENDDANSLFTVEGLSNGNVELVRSVKEAALPEELVLYSGVGKGSKSNVTVSYTVSEDSKDYESYIVIEGTTVKITDEFPTEVSSFNLTATYEQQTSTVTVNIKDKMYNYTIYYYDVFHAMNKGDIQLWIWENGGPTPAKAFTLDDEEQLSDNNTWLKTKVELSYKSLGIIGREYGEESNWSDVEWQDDDQEYIYEGEEEEVTLYYVWGQGVYDQLPKIEGPSRYLVVEYERTTQTDKDWYFYTWNSGYSGFHQFDKSKSDTWIAKVPVKEGVSSVSFCLERTDEKGEHWGEKDGGDYLSPMPVDQKVVKIKVKEGEGVVTYTYPYNTGYELDPENKKVHFYYRDDEAFLAGSNKGAESVTLAYGTLNEDGTALNETKNEVMEWVEEEQRWAVDLDLPTDESGNLQSVTYYYRYKLDNDKYITDSFNKAPTETIADVEYSVCTYEKFELEVTAKMLNASMDYNENNVLTVSLQVKDSSDTDNGSQDGDEGDTTNTTSAVEDAADAEGLGVEVSKVVVNLRSVGGEEDAEIDPELLQLAIAVKEGTELGSKTLPVVVYDQYNNKYTAETTVNVVSRVKNSDFDWDEAVIYFAVTDRFFDGNAGNNGTKDKGYDVSEYGSSSYHGGDFAGLTQKLDYLDDLGVNTIWITPIVANQETANDDDKVGASWSYHGYWAKDFEKLDSHLGTEAEFKALLDAAHARGMKIMVDVVLNHSGYGDDITNYFNNILKDEEGNPIRMIREASEMVSGDDQKTSLLDLPDFLTENKEVRELLVEWQSNWISKYDIDYYRVDTVKHVDATTWSAFKNALTAIDPDFKMIGEWAGAGYATDTGMLRTGRMDSLLDFDFNDQAAAFVKGNIASVEGFLSNRNKAIDNTASLGAFLGSHDEDGFVYALVNEKDSQITQERAQDLGLVAASLQLTVKGQVVIYYGEEIGMTGADNYPYQTNRYDFDWSQANSSNATLAHYKTMLAIRDRYSEVLAKGTRTTITADDESGLDVFKRELNGTTLTVALNIKDKAQTVTVKTSLPAGTVLYDYYATYRSGNRIQYVVGTDGNVEITVPAAADGGTVVLTAGTPVGSGDVESGELQEGFDVAYIANKSYTGKNITLSEDELKVYYNGQLLTIKKDYTASYKNNKTPGTATITIKGKGNYAGTVTTTFDIVAKNVNDDDIVIDYKDLVATGKAQKPLSKITNNGIKLGAKDYTVKYYLRYVNGSRAGSALTGVTATGTYEMVIEGTGNYTGTRTEIVHVIDGTYGTYMNKTKVTLQYNGAAIPKAGIAYTGSPITKDTGLSIEVTKGNDPVAADCYEVTYSNNTEVGTATVTLTGVYSKGYVGSVSKTFKIAGKKLSSVAAVDTSKFKDSVEFDFLAGEVVQTDSSEAESSTGLLKLKDGVTDDKFTKDSYTVTYSKNDKPGKATAVFTGQHGFTGTIKKTFTIKAIDFSETNKKIEGDVTTGYTIEASAPYRKAGAKAAVAVQYKGKALEENKDYTLKYSKNGSVTDGSTAEVKVSGKGAFTGNYTLNFKVDQVDLTKLGEYGIELTAPDVVFVNKNGKYKSVPVLDGLKISGKAAKEYTLTYYAKEVGSADYTAIKDPYTAPAGTDIKVEVTPVTGKNSAKNYTGTGTAYYRVANASIAKAKVSVKAQEYTGKEIVLGKNDFSSVKVGKDTLVWGKDYEIVPGSYTNNINKGNASVTIRGIGNYTGEKKVTFKITSRFVTWWWNLFK